MDNLRYILFVLCLLLGFSTSFAQFSSMSNGPVPDIHKKATVPFVSAPTAGGDIAYGYAGISAVTISMPMPTGTPFTTLAAFSFPNFGSTGVRGGDGIYYFLDYLNPSLYQFDPGSGIITFIGYITGMGGINGNGLAYDGTSGKYYICGGFFGDTNNLYELDIATRIATLVGSFPSPSGAMIDIAINSSGVGYGYDLIDDMAYTFDPSTASATVLGPLGYDANFGQGMDIDQATGTIYLSAFNNGTFTGQLRTMDPVTGNTTLIVDWGFEQVAPFAINNDYGAPIGPGPATDPIPASGTTDVSVSISDLVWTNPAGAISLEVYFGDTPSEMALIYSGAVVTSVGVPGTPINYSTTYYWKVNEIDGSGTTSGSIWNFTTEQDPIYTNIFFDDFEDGSGKWIITNDGGDCVWEIFDIHSRPYTMPVSANGLVFAADADICGSGTSTLTTAVIDQLFDATNIVDAWLEWDNDWQAISNDDSAFVEVSTDNGSTWQRVVTFDDVDVRNTHEFHSITQLVNNKHFLVRLVSVQPGWDWWWAIDNFTVYNFNWGYNPPAAPSNLTAFSFIEGEVELNWQDNSDDEAGFLIYRKLGDSTSINEFQQIEVLIPQNVTTFTDTTVEDTTTYTYFVLAYNWVGPSEPSNLATVTTILPVELIYFNSTIIEDQVFLTWQTATEINNSGFEVQRRLSSLPEQESFRRIGFAPGFGTTTEPKIYSFTDQNLTSGNYQYRLKQIDFDGSFEYSNSIEVTIDVPTKFSLEQNYPNPFNPATKIRYEIPNQAQSDKMFVTLKIYDVLGNEIATLINEEKSAGIYEVEFDAAEFTSGVYFYQLNAGDQVFTRKMILMK